MASKQDITHVHRELRTFTDEVVQSIMRHDDPVKYPPISDSLRTLAIENQVDLRDPKVCDNLLLQLEEVKHSSPTVHISFPADPSREVLQKLVKWFRKEVDPKIIYPNWASTNYCRRCSSKNSQQSCLILVYANISIKTEIS